MDSKAVVTLAKLESGYGVDATPDGADAIQTSEVKISPFMANVISRNLDRAGFGGDQQIHVGVHLEIEFSVEAVGSGTLGTAPAYAKLLKACACSETIVAATSVTYKPDRTVTDSLTISFFMDGQRHKMVGARGTFRLMLDSQQIPHFVFTFTGLWVDPSSVAAPAALTGWSAFQIPSAVTFDDTPTVALHGTNAVFMGFSFDQGNKVEYFDNPGERYVGIVDRESTGSLKMLAPTLTSKNWFTTAKANTLGTLTFSHGSASTHKVILAAASNTVQVLQPKYGDDRGRATLECNLGFVPTATNDDDWAIRFAAA